MVKRFTDFVGLGRSWSVHVYILDGFPPNPVLAGNEDPLPPLGTTPHPDHLPFVNDLQQAEHDQQVWQQQNADIAWDQAAAQLNIGVHHNQNGWGNWDQAPVIPVGFAGTSMREVTGYEGPSMMDGVLPENNVQGDSAALWNEHIMLMERAAKDILNGVFSGGVRFLRAGGMDSEVLMPLSTCDVFFFAKFYSVVSTPKTWSGFDGAF